MSRTSSTIGTLLAFLGLVAIIGCEREPTPPPRPQLDPQQAADRAIKLYGNKSGDGTLGAKELRASPPLQELLQNLKVRAEKSGGKDELPAYLQDFKARTGGHADSLTAADISGRIDEWLKSSAVLMPGTFMVSLDGKMLEGATVTLVPEPFLGPSYHSHEGVTDAAGTVKLDAELPGYPGDIYVGLYLVRISKKVNGKETLPERYNTKTELGREIATNIRDSRGNLFFRLTSK